jgi:hypothetical protein
VETPETNFTKRVETLGTVKNRGLLTTLVAQQYFNNSDYMTVLSGSTGVDDSETVSAEII